MTASLLRPVLRHSIVPALLAACFVATNAGCGDDDDDDAPSRVDGDRDGRCSRRRPPPGELVMPCADMATVVLNAPGALRAGVDPSTLWVRACVDASCVDAPLFDGRDAENLDDAVFRFGLDLRGSSCNGPRIAALSVYDTLAKAPLFTETREVSTACPGKTCVAPEIAFAVPDDAFACESRGALVTLRADEAIALPAGAVPTGTVCVDGDCSDAIFFPLTPEGIAEDVTIDVLVQGVERSRVEATGHQVKLTINPGGAGPLYTETFELSLDPITSFSCAEARVPDLVLPLRPEMFGASDEEGGGRPPPFEPATGSL